jgi:lysosomal Pro-X carboxypeptidase
LETMENLLVEAIGISRESMFVPRAWSIEWLTQHCRSRFGVTPRPYELVSKWHFDELVVSNVSHILFTNGLKDGWSVSGIQTNLSDTLIALNFPNGAHHSDLSHLGPNENDTEDVMEGYKLITRILGLWIDEIFESAKFMSMDGFVN